MIKTLIIGICLLFPQQEPVHQLIDIVDLPGELVGLDTNPQLKSGWYLEFNETWTITPGRSSISKSVAGYKIRDRNNPRAAPDSLQLHFSELMEHLPVAKGSIRLTNITYEFLLLDPPTRLLQGELIKLVQSQTDADNIYDFQHQLLSVWFHEEWSFDPLSQMITKKVLGITPVIWQRRQSNSGEPVNDAESGLPVYYKIQLDRIELRNP